MKKRRSLFWKLYPSYLLLSLSVSVALGWFAAVALHDLYLERTQESLERQAGLLEDAVQRTLFSPDPSAVDRLCKTIGRRAETRVTVVLGGGRVVGDSDEDPAAMDYHNKRPEILEAMAGRVGVSNRYSRTLRQPMMYVAVPLRADGQVRAVLRTSAPTRRIEEILAANRVAIFLFSLLFVLLATAMCRYVAGRLAEPVRQHPTRRGGFCRKIILPRSSCLRGRPSWPELPRRSTGWRPALETVSTG